LAAVSDAPAAVPAVRLRSAVAVLGRFPALAGVDLDVGRGEVVLLQGPNGAGKTTVLRVCAGLVPVVEGHAEVLGIDLSTDRGGVRRRVGLLGHASGLYGELTVEENARFWARAAGVGRADAMGALDRMGVASRLHGLSVNALSAGQRRRVAFACVLARRPELWLLDEPHSGLDSAGRDVVDGLVREGVAAGATVLFASHELDRAEGLAHRTVHLAGGTAAEGAA
jgi:heme ABC exporter ATP-binding subunit CcmA